MADQASDDGWVKAGSDNLTRLYQDLLADGLVEYAERLNSIIDKLVLVERARRGLDAKNL